jgi:two-component system, NarL family, response regulator LiaR
LALLSSFGQAAMNPIRVVLIEDHDLMRAGMQLSLQQQGILVVGEAATGEDGLRLTEKLHPDVVIVDLGLPDIDGIEVTRQIKQLADCTSKVLVLTFRDEPRAVLAAFAAGADSYCMKDVSPDRLLEAMQTTHAGHHWIDPAIAGIVLQQTLSAAPLPSPEQSPETVNIRANAPEYEQILADAPLTDRELEVLRLIVEGDGNALIAEKLYITIGTVKTHVRNILNKLCADDRTQAAVRALRSGLIR